MRRHLKQIVALSPIGDKPLTSLGQALDQGLDGGLAGAVEAGQVGEDANVAYGELIEKVQ